MNIVHIRNYPILIALIFNCSILNIMGCKPQKEITSADKQTEEKQTAEVNSQRPEVKIEPVQSTENTKQAIAKDDSLFVTIERTPCFGKCPVYKIYIYNGGYVVYDGKQNVDKIGRFSTQLSTDELKLIEQRAKEIKYLELNDKYDGPVTDLPSVHTSVAMDGYRKSITARYNVPSELKEFQKFIDNLFIEKYWVLLGLAPEK